MDVRGGVTLGALLKLQAARPIIVCNCPIYDKNQDNTYDQST